MEDNEKRNELILEYAELALKSAKEGRHVDDSEDAERAHEIRIELSMNHKSVCCSATNIVVTS